MGIFTVYCVLSRILAIFYKMKIMIKKYMDGIKM